MPYQYLKMQLNKCEIKNKIYKSKIRKLISAVFPGSKGEKFATRLRKLRKLSHSINKLFKDNLEN